MSDGKFSEIERLKTRQLVEFVGNALENGAQYDLKNLVADFPAAVRKDCLERAIRLEIDFYRRKGWTYNLRRHEEFPELSAFISKAISGKPDSVNEMAGSNEPQSRYVAQCEYLANRWAFAEGGQGALYEATDCMLGGREVAIKVLKNVHDVNRFFQEAEITARLDHPGIAAVFSWSAAEGDADTVDKPVDQRPFYAMRLINGKPLQERLADFHNRVSGKKVPLVQDPEFILLIESLISACHTIAYAHSVGVLHCDVKPQNIMCGDFGATIVLDWGSAVSNPNAQVQAVGGRVVKRIRCPEWTSDSQYTTAYASPEQKERTPILDAATDVYSLGATLYQIITGHSPIDQNDHLDRQRQDLIGAVRRSKPDCPKALESICIRALKLNPRHRYQGPAELANDLSCWLRGEEVSAAPDNFLDKTFRLANRHRLATSLGLLAAGLILLGTIGYNATRYQRLKLQASLDSGLNLIENICGPLENGELQNPEELAAVSRLVLEHCNKEIDNKESKIEDNMMRGRLFHLRALTRFFDNNHIAAESGGAAAAVLRAGDLLDLAIEDIEQAIEAFRSFGRSTSNQVAASARGRLSGSLLFKARLLFTRSNRNLAEKGDRNDLEGALAAIESIEPMTSQKKSLDPEAVPEFRMAESWQLKGEILLRKATQANSTQDATRNYQLAAEAFKQCNLILESVTSRDAPSRHKQARGLGRGYGYLGDVYRDLKQYSEAFASYKQSLSWRRKITDLSASPENQRQLSRGFANFAWTLRNLGVLPGDVASRDDREPPTTPDVLVLETLDAAERQKMILSAIDKYMGEFESQSNHIETRALNLLYGLKELDEKSSRREIGTALCLVSELYFQAAVQTGTVDLELLGQAKHFCGLAEEILRTLYAAGNDDRETKTGLGYCLTLMRQINHSLDPDSDFPSVGKILELLPKVTDQNVSSDELFLRCIAFSCGASEFNSELENGLRRLADSGFQYEWRFKQHFSDEDLKYFQAQQPASSGLNNQPDSDE